MHAAHSIVTPTYVIANDFWAGYESAPDRRPGNAEVNHIQLIPAGGPLSLAQAQGTYNPDPACR